MNYNVLSFTTRSQYRIKALRQLQNRPQTPKEVTRAVDDAKMSDIARAIQQLREKGLVELLVDEDVNKGRYYALTESGEEILAEIEERRAEWGDLA